MSEEGEKKTELETLWKTYDTINEWIRFSDTKAVAILGINGVVAGFVFSNLKELKLVLSSYPIILIPLIIGIFTCSVSVYFSIICLAPTLKVGDRDSLIFFAHVAEKFKTPGDYEKAVRQILKNDNDLMGQITNQVWSNSKVAWKKYNAVVWCTRFFILTVLICIGAIIIAFVLWMR